MKIESNVGYFGGPTSLYIWERSDLSRLIMVDEIKPNTVYTTEEARDFLKVSESTFKRLLKRGVIKAHKVGGQYRIWGAEILRLVSPQVENEVYKAYRKFKDKTKKILEKW